MNTASPMVIEGFFDPTTSTISYLLLDPVRPAQTSLLRAFANWA
jgi:hypothetical protein